MRTTTAAGRTWHFSHALGRATAEHNGKTGGTETPVSITLAPDDIIFILSRGFGYPLPGYGRDIGCRIGKTTLDENHLGDFSRGGFTWPVSIARAADGNLYVSDEYENVIKGFGPDGILPPFEYDPEGEHFRIWGEKGSGEGQLDGPSGLEFDDDDNLYVVDSRNDRVQKFTKDGKYLSGWGESGSGEGQFNRPWGITVDAEGSVYVADWGNDRVQKFTAGGDYLMTFGTPPEQGGGLRRPADVAVDSDGDVYVADWGEYRVQIYEPDGQHVCALHGDIQSPLDSKAGDYVTHRDPETVKAYARVDDLSPLGKFGRPVAIEVDHEDRVIIAESKHRLQVYAKDHEYAEPKLSLRLVQ